MFKIVRCPHRYKRQIRTFLDKPRRERKAQMKRQRQIHHQQRRELRRALIARDGRCCAACGAANCPMTIDHIVPISRGGLTRMENLQLLCPACNELKSDWVMDFRPEREAEHG